MIEICTFKWGDRYTLRHVSALNIALRRHLTIPYRFNLISDDPDDEAFCVKAGIRFIPLWSTMANVKNCGRRLYAFKPLMRTLIGERFAWLDLDVVLTGNVDHIFSRPEPFVGLKTPAPPMAFNGTFVMMDAGAFPDVLDSWTPERYEACGQFWIGAGCAGGGASDEGWMSYQLQGRPGVATVGGQQGVDGIYYFKRHMEQRFRGRIPLPADARMVVMNGKRFDPSMPEWHTRAPWILEHWTPAF